MSRIIYYGQSEREILEEHWEDFLLCGMRGWKDIFMSLVDDLFKLGWDGRILQIKEKFGGLRIYTAGCSDEIFDRVLEAESQSLKTCMECGKPGSPKGDYWILTLCQEHRDKRDERENGILGFNSNPNSSAV